jgi:hypothetical protein
VEAVPDGAGALVVGHGGGIEPGLVACVPNADHGSWGKPFGHCDGTRLGFDDGRFVSVQFRRAPRCRYTQPPYHSTSSTSRSQQSAQPA